MFFIVVIYRFPLIHISNLGLTSYVTSNLTYALTSQLKSEILCLNLAHPQKREKENHENNEMSHVSSLEKELNSMKNLTMNKTIVGKLSDK